MVANREEYGRRSGGVWSQSGKKKMSGITSSGRFVQRFSFDRVAGLGSVLGVKIKLPGIVSSGQFRAVFSFDRFAGLGSVLDVLSTRVCSDDFLSYRRRKKIF